MKIVSFVLTGVLLSVAPFLSSGKARADDIHMAQTRFGLADGSSNVLKINGRLTTPEIDGNSGMFVEKITEAGNADYLLVTSIGGSGCPAFYSFVKVTRDSATPTAYFGNCSDLPKRSVVPGKSVTLVFPAYRPLRSTSGGVPAESYVYSLTTNVLKKNGKPISTACKGGKCE